MATKDQYINDFAIRSFRDVADGDYIGARLACRAALGTQFLWSSQQALEKYLKCVLLLNRIDGRNVRHSLDEALKAITKAGNAALDLTPATREFIEYIDFYGHHRYLEISYYADGRDILKLDRAVWELRRFCTLAPGPRTVQLKEGEPPPLVVLPGGRLEKIIVDVGGKQPFQREALLWQNPYFGVRRRRTVYIGGWMHGENAPLFLKPGILDEIKQYVYIPKKVEEAYREAAASAKNSSP